MTSVSPMTGALVAAVIADPDALDQLAAVVADATTADATCHLETYECGRGWAGPLCGSRRATRCAINRLTTRYAGDKVCPACLRPVCAVCAAQERGG